LLNEIAINQSLSSFSFVGFSARLEKSFCWFNLVFLLDSFEVFYLIYLL
jgi:hypothetical protein